MSVPILSALCLILIFSCEVLTFSGKESIIFTTERLTFGDAKKYCEDNYGTIVKIESTAENNFIKDIYIKEIRKELGDNVHTWIGVDSASPSKSPETYIDGSPIIYNNFKRSKWTSECNAVHISVYGEWYVFDCNDKCPVICAVNVRDQIDNLNKEFFARTSNCTSELEEVQNNHTLCVSDFDELQNSYNELVTRFDECSTNVSYMKDMIMTLTEEHSYCKQNYTEKVYMLMEMNEQIDEMNHTIEMKNAILEIKKQNDSEFETFVFSSISKLNDRTQQVQQMLIALITIVIFFILSCVFVIFLWSQNGIKFQQFIWKKDFTENATELHENY